MEYIQEIANGLEAMDYYQTVARGYIIEAVAAAVEAIGRGRPVEEYHRYISEELI